MKKIISVLLAMGMLVSLAGCGKSSTTQAPAATETPAATQAAATEAAATQAPTVAASNPTDLTMWCIAVESDSNRKAYMSAIDELKKANPNINLKWEATQNQDYKTKIKAAAAANELPDVFFTWGGGFLRDFVQANRVYCLDNAYANYSSELPDKVLTNHKVDGKLYAAPTNYNFVAMFANMDLLKQAGYDSVPGTYDELMACCDALVAKGIIPFGCSGKETWAVSEYFESILEKSVGAATLSDMYLGKTSWNNEGVAKAVDNFQNMIKKNYFDPEGIALSNDEVKANFLAGKYAFYINGTWNGSDVDKANMQDKVQIAEFPVIDSTKSQLGELIGGPNDSLAVSAASKNPEVAAKAAFELAKSVAHHGYLNGNGLPAWNVDYDTSSLSKLTLKISEIFNNSKQVVLFGDGIQSADKANIYLDYVSQIYASAIDGKTFASKLDSDLKK